MRAGESGSPVVAIVGMGYVGLPTALALHATGVATIGLDVDEGRLAAIKEGQVDLVPADHRQLGMVCDDPDFRLTTDASRLADADAVIVCVPTPLDSHLTPDLQALTGACRTVVDHARADQTLIVTSTSFVCTTRDLLTNPLREKGFEIGEDILVAFAGHVDRIAGRRADGPGAGARRRRGRRCGQLRHRRGRGGLSA